MLINFLVDILSLNIVLGISESFDSFWLSTAQILSGENLSDVINNS